MGLGTRSIFFASPPGLTALGEHINVSQNVQTVLVGVNYRFNFGGPIATRY
jgi:outer membrane immunogenic protein